MSSKPEQYSKILFDYMQCKDYIEKKYNISGDDFWLWLCDLNIINNGGLLTIYKDMFAGWPKKKITKQMKEFLKRLFQEFGVDKEEIQFEVWW